MKSVCMILFSFIIHAAAHGQEGVFDIKETIGTTVAEKVLKSRLV
ncbi:hypothetical protein SAMN04488522_1011280 [Pedobacter caeni]|uniref:Uncharacterized protein n=1 Tax=Pedobacter caeni TaxID=288992 RepID=A0A1M4WJ60_9SPHI|nr:hypothetical protein SAMN04488522_1011280 [Pedobacter caeni]